MNAKSVLTLASVLFGVAAAYFLYSGFALDTSAGGTASVELMHVQSLNFITGIGAAIISAIFGSASVFAR